MMMIIIIIGLLDKKRETREQDCDTKEVKKPLRT